MNLSVFTIQITEANFNMSLQIASQPAWSPPHSCFQTYMVKEFTLHSNVYKMLSRFNCLVSKIHCLTRQAWQIGNCIGYHIPCTVICIYRAISLLFCSFLNVVRILPCTNHQNQWKNDVILDCSLQQNQICNRGWWCFSSNETTCNYLQVLVIVPSWHWAEKHHKLQLHIWFW